MSDEGKITVTTIPLPTVTEKALTADEPTTVAGVVQEVQDENGWGAVEVLLNDEEVAADSDQELEHGDVVKITELEEEEEEAAAEQAEGEQEQAEGGE